MSNKLKNTIYQLLRKSEKWTGTDMIYLAKNSFWLTISKIIGTLTALGLAIAYANLLPKEVYATYKYILSVASLLVIATLPGINTSLMRSVTLGFEGSIKQAVKTKLKWSTAGVLAGLTISGYYFYHHNSTLGIGFLAAAITTPILNSLIYGPYLQGKKQFKTISVFNSLKQIIAAVVVAGAIWLSPTALTIILAYYGINLILQLAFFIITFKKYKPNEKQDPQMISFGKHLSLMGILGTLAEQADKILMWHLLGARQLAIYSFATLPITQAQSFLKSIPTIAFPKIATQNIEIIKKTLPKKIAKFMAILTIPVIIYVLAAPYIYKLLFPQYLEAVKYSQLFALTLIFFPQRILGQALVAYAQTKSLYVLKIIEPLLRIILLFSFLYFLNNIYGAIVAIIFYLALSWLISYYFLLIAKK